MVRPFAHYGVEDRLSPVRTAELVALVYLLYLLVVGVARGHVRAAVTSAGVLAVVGALGVAWARAPTTYWLQLTRDAWPLVLLFVGYRVTGLFYTRPNTTVEHWLLHVDHAIAARMARVVRWRGAAIARPWLELAYLSVYPLIPLGAIAMAYARPDNVVDGFWTIVLTAGFTCYGALPWIQTRPPRCLEGGGGPTADGVRRLNLAILERGSVGVNTLPSGHAATAVATALVVLSYASPLAGVAFLIAAASIALATVVGRYHYAVDTILGVLVGAIAWLVIPIR